MSSPALGARRARKLLTTNQEALLTRYTEAVIEASDLLHLTSEKDKPFFRARHVNDAVALAQRLPAALLPHQPLQVLDVGTGNGVPGLVLAILFPEWHVDLMDSSNKKCLFLDAFIKNNAIKNVSVLCDRAEFLAHKTQREAYDLVFSRALGKLPSALELTIPFLKVDHHLIVSHGTTWQEELRRSDKALELLQTQLQQTIPYTLETYGQFMILIFKKLAPTLERYPRNVGIPTKRPL